MSTARALVATLLAIPLLVATASGSDPGNGEAHPELWPASHSTGLVDAKTEARISELLGRLSLEEKVGQLIQADIGNIKPEELRRYPVGGILAGGSTPPLGADDRSMAPAWIATARAFRAVSVEARPGHVPIPVIFGIDAVHGNNNIVGATLFPHNIGLGAMHDPALIRKIGVATAVEVAASGIDWAFGPTLAVPQDTRWGRAYEGYSEDPAVVRAYAGEMVRGLQGDVAQGGLLQRGHVAASAKHFLADGGTRDGIDQGNAEIDEATLIDTHAQGYLSAIPAGAMTVMASYSSWQGRKMHGNKSLLTEVLKGRLGFEGFVVGDWNGHGQVPGCTPSDCAATINAGLDMIMAPDHWKELYTATLAEARSGLIPMSRIDDAVRRILRVKLKLGLFDPQRPFEGRLSEIGAPAHRAVARQAVRESLVLLKNNGHVLPIRGGAHVLVAGAAADDIGRQSGGWTLSWQGTGNKNSDFPGGESIYAGLRAALEKMGGSVELNVDGQYTQRPDVAVVVFGEIPYAEMVGDLRNLEYEPGQKSDLALLARLHAQGIPVVAVFLSGRPMWVNPEINASDAFVAAWFPGSEGGGVADVLVGDAAGKPRHDFSGRLSFTWPRTALPVTRGGSSQFALGYGLDYRSADTVAPLPGESGVSGQAWNVERYFMRGHTPAPWNFTLPADGNLSMHAVDAGGVQEAARAFEWQGRGTTELAITAEPTDLTRQTNGDLVLLIDYRVDAAPTAPVQLAMQCSPACAGAELDASAVLKASPPGEWRQLRVRLACFRDAGVDMAHVTSPFTLRTDGRLGLSLLGAQLSTDPAGAVCLPRANTH
jgi:beta-glucosidase